MQGRQQAKKWQMTPDRKRAYNSGLVKVWGSCFYGSEVLNQTFTHPLNIVRKRPPLTKP